jgi:superfamily II DNA/RNA helicase
MADFRRPDLLKGIFAMGFDKPSKIQEKALPLLLADPFVFSSYFFNTLFIQK